jgi:hypothetical protein
MIRLSSVILDENDSFRSKVNNLVLNNQILKSEKELLIAEVFDKKDLVMKMYRQLQHKYRRD